MTKTTDPRRFDGHPVVTERHIIVCLDSGVAVECHPPGCHGIDRHVPQLSIHTPIGDLTLFEEDGRIVALDWGWASNQEATPFLRGIAGLLDAYFDGVPLPDDLPLSPAGGTAYQRRVWNALRAIPSGRTLTYGELARIAGGGPRSVGAANGANPIPILIPCHRVVAASGIGGYSGGDGLPTKRYLLDLEAGRHARHPSETPKPAAIG